jgi:hypothetical protein
MFKRPKWLRPEIEEPKYWLHLVIIAVVVLGILKLWVDVDMFNIETILLAIPLFAIGDIVAHTLLGFD